MIFGFTGTQDGMTKTQRELFYNLCRHFEPGQLHHGDCIGADKNAQELYLSAMYYRYQAGRGSTCVMIHPPIKDDKRAFCTKPHSNVLFHSYEPKDYLDRNHDIVDACDILIACPKSHTEELRSGTWATIRYARKRFRPVIILV
jgi:hypothetical protein